ncbi:hypothetical protein E2C01_087273 [Portunus trituberculatus]|uniref:Uncharacterized protein n=1 Tax=Portunus trituberculatus TaxID=210409 RepID=A0A5B7JGV2_PORTR|nr:hypothetical protein [Portunus trituberculatus]
MKAVLCLRAGLATPCCWR